MLPTNVTADKYSVGTAKRGFALPTPKGIPSGQGLVPALACYDICRNAWNRYIRQSLASLITTGTGRPNSAENPQTEDEKRLASAYATHIITFIEVLDVHRLLLCSFCNWRNLFSLSVVNLN